MQFIGKEEMIHFEPFIILLDKKTSGQKKRQFLEILDFPGKFLGVSNLLLPPIISM